MYSNTGRHAPGPLVTKAIPGNPDNFPAASAILEAPASCLQVMTLFFFII